MNEELAMDHSREKLSRSVRLAAAMMGCNQEILARSPPQDRHAVVAEAMLLALVSGISALAWGAFWAQFLPLIAAIALAAVADAFIFLLDSRIGASRWVLTGILRKPGGRPPWKDWLLIARFAMTVILSAATSTGATMAMFHNTIETQLEADRRETNQQIEARSAEKTRAAAQLHHGTLLPLVDKLSTTVADTTRVLDTARQARVAAFKEREAAQIEADRELRGAPGYKKGPGTKYREALAHGQTADANLAKAEADIAIYEPRLVDAQRKLDEARAELTKAEADFRPIAERLEHEKNAQLVPERNDSLLSYIALQKVFNSPIYGEPARHFAWMMMSILMTIELTYLIVRVWFSHASVYIAMLIADTKLRADRIAFYYSRESEKLTADYVRERPRLMTDGGRRPTNERGPLHIVAYGAPEAPLPEPPNAPAE